MKKLLPILVFCGGVLFSSAALADFEFVELIINVLKQVEAVEQTVQRQKQNIESTINKLAQGPLGSIISEIKIEVEKAPNNKQPIAVAEGLNNDNIQEVEEAYKSTIPNYDIDNQIPTSLAGEAANEEYLRTSLEQLYAQAFTLRTTMERDRQNEREDPVDLPETHTRAMELARDESIETINLLKRLLFMESSLDELQIRMKLRGMHIDKDQE